MTHAGQCHCGKIKASFETQKTPEALGVRTCQCAFCRRHGAVNVSDPEGLVTIDAAPDDLIRYRFALRTADFLICRVCGVYVAAVMGEGERICSTINIVGVRMEAFFGIDEAPADYDAESAEARIERRYTRWTPTRFNDSALQASNFGPHDR
jgi:hypothetical protein